MRKVISALLILAMILLSSLSGDAYAACNARVISNGYTTFIIKPNGTVYGWGRNTYGEVGNGTTDDQHTPGMIHGLSNIIEIIPNTSGSGYFFAIDNVGRVYSWGYNGYGQLGLGTTTNQVIPTSIDGIPAVSHIISNSNYTTYAITPDGDVYAWGNNCHGQVANGNKNNQLTPYKIENLPKVTSLTCKNSVVFALTVGKEVYAWGLGTSFQMGNGGFVSAQTSPVKISGLSNVDEVITNSWASFAICNNRQEVYSWGKGSYGELGTNSVENRTPKRVWVLSDINETIDKMVFEMNTCFAITSSGTLYGWGGNYNCQLGNGKIPDEFIPKLTPNLPKVKQFIFNGYSGIALGVDGCVYSWGKNLYGELGTDDNYGRRYVEKIITLGNNIVEIYNGNNAMFAKDTNGNLYGWGTNTLGQAGIGSADSIVRPAVIPGLSNISYLRKTGNTVFASDSDGEIFSWGDNRYGQLGNGSTVMATSPSAISIIPMTTVTGTGNVNSVVPIVGSINALTISITHPVNISYSIDPNSEDGFICSDINIQNNSKVPVKIQILSFAIANDSDLAFQDVLPDGIEWSNLSLEDSKRYIALGLMYVDESQWMTPQSDLLDPLYAVEINNSYIGALAKGAIGTLRLYGKHGLAFDGNYSARHELVFLVSLH